MIFRWNRPWVFILRRAYEHFDEIVVQAIVDLPLQMPGKLRMIEIARMNWKDILMHRNGRVLQIDQNLDDAVRFARGKCQQRMNVKAEVSTDLRQIRRVRHLNILLTVRRKAPPLQQVGFVSHGNGDVRSA